MTHEKLDTAIEYVAKKYGITKVQANDIFMSQFRFMRHILLTEVDPMKEKFLQYSIQNSLHLDSQERNGQD